MVSGDLILGLGAAAVWVAILMWSDRKDARRLWPPHEGGLVTAGWAWALTIAIYVGQIGAGAEQWNQFGWPAWLRHGVGGGMSILGSLYQSWGVAVLGIRGTSGWAVPLATTGPYAQTRHPQYLGQVATFIGIAIWSASPAAWIIGLAGCFALTLAARVETRHLARRAAGHGSWAARVPGILS